MPGEGLAPYLECMGSMGVSSEASGQIPNQERSPRRQWKWEAQENNSLGSFPKRRTELGHWDLLTEPAGVSRTLGRTQTKGCGRGSGLPLLMVEGDILRG